MDDLFYKAYEAAQKGRSFAFATIIESTIKGTPRKAGAKMVVFEDGKIWGSIGGGRNERNASLECQEAIKTQKPKIVSYKFDEKPGNSICGGEIKIFIEPFAGKKHCVICGAGHIALPLSAMLKMLNYKVTIIDNRPEFANSKRYPHVDEVLLGEHNAMLQKISLDKNSFVVIVTHGYEHDFRCLEIALKSKAAYVGFISSKVKKVKFIRKLRDKGISEKNITRIHAPMGLNIGAQTPEEIAVSIAAELISYNNNNVPQDSLTQKYSY